MSKTLGPVLATGTITLVNQSVLHHQPVDWRIPIATGLAGIAFGLAERVWPEGVDILAWTALVTVLITRTDPKVPSPTESIVAWFDGIGNPGLATNEPATTKGI